MKPLELEAIAAARALLLRIPRNTVKRAEAKKAARALRRVDTVDDAVLGAAERLEMFAEGEIHHQAALFCAKNLDDLMTARGVSVCDCCGNRYDQSTLGEVKDFWSRATPGYMIPSGECPDCGSFCYPDNDRTRAFFAVDDLIKVLGEIAERAESNAQDLTPEEDAHGGFIRIRDDAWAAVNHISEGGR